MKFFYNLGTRSLNLSEMIAKPVKHLVLHYKIRTFQSVRYNSDLSKYRANNSTQWELFIV